MDELSAHLDRGWDLVQAGDLQGALRSVEHVLEIEPQSPEAYNLLGAISAARGDHEEAIEYFRQTIDLDPEYGDPYLNAAEMLIFELGDHEQALALCDELLEFTDDPVELMDGMLLKIAAIINLGEVMMALEMLWDEDEESLGLIPLFNRIKAEGAIKEVNWRIALHVMDCLLNDYAHYEEVERIGQMLLRELGDEELLAEVELILADTEADKGDFDRAEEIVVRVPEAMENPHIQLRAGRILFDIGVLDKAEERLRLSLRLKEDIADSHYYLGRLLEEQGELEEMIQHYLRVLDLDWLVPNSWILGYDEFEGAVNRAMEEVQDNVRPWVESAKLSLKDRPSRELVEGGLDPRAMVALQGVEAGQSKKGKPQLKELTLFRSNFERSNSSLDDVEVEVSRAISQEVAFFLGLTTEEAEEEE